MYSLCQRCHVAKADTWNVRQAEFHVGKIEHWKVQLCPQCAEFVEQAVLGALEDKRD